MIDLKYTTNGFDRRIRLPIDEQSVPEVLEPDSMVFVSEIIQPASLNYLAGARLNIDELNFLAKRMDSFDKREMAQFNAAVGYRAPYTGQELINLTFNLPRYTLISDFSSPTEIGKTHILNRKQVMGLDEIARTDFAQIGRDLMISGTGITTEYGVLFINEDIPEESPYDGKHFPAYDYKVSPVCVSISCKGETEYLYMPCSVADINNALAKLPAESWNDCKAEIEWDNLPSKEWSDRCERILQNEDSYQLNEVCKALKGFDENDYAKLSAALQLTHADDSATIIAVAGHLDEFRFVPEAHNSADVGRYWIDDVHGLEYDRDLEDYIDFEGYGENVISHYDGRFLENGGYIAPDEGLDLDKLLETAQEERRIHEEAMKTNTPPALDDKSLITERFFFPLTYSLTPFNEYGDLDWSNTYEDNCDEYAEGYESDVQEAFDKYTKDDECDMIEYYDRDKSAREKIVSAKWGFEEVEGKLYGVVTAKLKSHLTIDEEEDFRDWISGQNSDGLGEGFEQQDIDTDDGVLNVHFWNSSDDYFLGFKRLWQNRNAESFGNLSRIACVESRENSIGFRLA